MFRLFKRERKPSIADLVFIDNASRMDALLRASGETPAPLFVTWYENTREELQEYFNTHGRQPEIIIYRQLHHGIAHGRHVIVIGHFPLPGKEKQLFSTLEENKISVFSSLEDAFFKFFGGQNIARLMEKIGGGSKEPLSHPLITSSISKAQEKISSKIIVEQHAESMDEWFRKNLPQENAS